MRLLDVRGITAFYGKAQALFDVSLHVDRGEVVAILGRNGTGKTTTIKTICRMLPFADGDIAFAGQSLKGLASHQAARLGLGLVPEGRRCFQPLTVLENLTVAARPGTHGTRWSLDDVIALFPRLGERQAQVAATLSGGEQQMLAIARALMTNPRLLLLDEATEGLAPVIREEIWRALGALKRDGQSILLVDKNLAEMRAVLDRCIIFERGRSVWTGGIGDLSSDLSKRYLAI
ncbi:MAG: ABC transporter ATP-binding protein [Pseudomonadota bacterium]